ncbi:MAG: flagellar motor switch protein FliN [Bdellovibrionota bacterium]
MADNEEKKINEGKLAESETTQDETTNSDTASQTTNNQTTNNQATNNKDVVVEGEVEGKDLANQEMGANGANDADEFEALSDIAKAAQDVADSANDTSVGARASNSPTLDYILDVTLQVSVEVGRAKMSIQDLLQLGQGAVVGLEKTAGEPLDIFMNGKQVAKGEAVIINERFGVRVTDVISREERALGLA